MSEIEIYIALGTGSHALMAWKLLKCVLGWTSMASCLGTITIHAPRGDHEVEKITTHHFQLKCASDSVSGY